MGAVASPTQGQTKFTAGENLAVGELLALNTSGEAVRSSSAFSSNMWRTVGSARKAATTGNTVSAGAAGTISPVLFGSAPPTSANGEFVFLSSVLGEGSLTPPAGGGNVRFVVGILKGADGATLTPDVLIQPQYLSRRP